MISQPWTDPVVEEVQRVRREYAARFGYDVEAIFHDLREEQESARREGRTVIAAPAHRKQRAEPAA